MKTLTFDLETIPLPLTPEQERPLKARAAAQEVSLHEYMAFNPVLSAVVAIGYQVDGLPPKAKSLRERGKERQLLSGFLKMAADVDRFVTFNGRSFAFPVLMCRAAALQLVVPTGIVTAAREYRYGPDRHVDVMELLTLYGASRRPSLDAVAIAFDVPDALGTGADGSQVLDMVNKSAWDDLEGYCMNDVSRTHAIYNTIQGMHGLPPTRRGRS